MAKRTVVHFETDSDIWSVVESWAKERNYREKKRETNYRLYQQGYGMLVAAKLVQVRQDGKQVEVQAWIHANIVARISALFLLPAELDLAPGFRGGLPRSTARRDLNILLQRFGQPPVYADKR